MSSAARYLIANAALFQVGWFVCVLAGSLWAVVYTAALLVVHFRFWPNPARDVSALLIALLLGLLHDNLLALAGVLVFPGSGFSPPWLWCLWLLMGLTFNHSLTWVYSRPLVAALLGAVAGPMAYGAGILLSDVTWGILPWQGLLVMAAVWMFVLPMHRLLALEGYRLCRGSV